MADEVDVVVIGMGVAGESVTGQLLDAGLDVVAIEGELVGGECPYWACVPTKMMIRGSDLLAEARRVDGMAGAATVTPDWKPIAARIREEATDNWNDRVAADRFTDKGGRLVRGWARLAGSGRVEVEDRLFVARRGVVLATGTRAVIPPVDGLADTPYWTNRNATEADTLPSSLLVLGGGVVGLEFAQIFARFGAEVTVVEVGDRVLATEEPEASELAQRALGADGVAFHVGTTVSSVTHDGKGFTLTLDDGRTLAAERLLVAAGRRANLTQLGLETVGLDPAATTVEVDEHMRAGERLWAVGDVTGRGAFTHVGTYQADIACRDILGRPGPPADYRALPRVTFTDPEIGAVGLTEQRAREAGVAVATASAQIPTTARGWIHKVGNDGFIKLVADTDRGVLVGATSAGPVGGEVLGALTVAVHGEVPVEKLRHMIYAYPTFHRGIEDALRELGS